MTTAARMAREGNDTRRAAQRLEQMRAALDCVARAAAAASRAPDAAALIEAVLDETVGALGGRAAHIYLLDPARGILRCAATRSLPADLVDQLREMNLDARFLASRAASSRRMEIVDDDADLDGSLHYARRVMAASGSRSMVSLPLTTRGALAGVLTVAFADTHSLMPETLVALRACGDLLAHGLT